MDEVIIFGLNYFKIYYFDCFKECFKSINLEDEVFEIIMVLI